MINPKGTLKEFEKDFEYLSVIGFGGVVERLKKRLKDDEITLNYFIHMHGEKQKEITNLQKKLDWIKDNYSRIAGIEELEKILKQRNSIKSGDKNGS